MDQINHRIFFMCHVELKVRQHATHHNAWNKYIAQKKNVHFPIKQSFVDKSDSVNRGFYQNKQKKHSKNKYEHINTTQYADHNIFAEKQQPNRELITKIRWFESIKKKQNIKNTEL